MLKKIGFILAVICLVAIVSQASLFLITFNSTRDQHRLTAWRCWQRTSKTSTSSSPTRIRVSGWLSMMIYLTNFNSSIDQQKRRKSRPNHPNQNARQKKDLGENHDQSLFAFSSVSNDPYFISDLMVPENSQANLGHRNLSMIQWTVSFPNHVSLV